MKIISILSMIFKLLPEIMDAVKVIEKAFPAGGHGKEKLRLIHTILMDAYDIYEDGGADYFNDEVWPYMKSVVDRVVAFFNDIGLFERGVKVAVRMPTPNVVRTLSLDDE